MMLRVAISGLVLAAILSTTTSAEDLVEFNRDIRPILGDKCLACHGPDNNKREADLRLDNGEGAFEDRGGSAVIVPGKPDESELIRRILSENPDERMPPASTQKSVTPEQVELLKRWIQQGAKFERHWSLLPPQRPATPTAGADWARNEIDRFIAASHAQRELKPSGDAERRILARRLSFDLTGLPPAPRDVEAFVADPSADAYENFVDRLLASPHFGERMAVYWLDVVRYADSGGYHSDNERELSPYRDYVIRAFNENLPFDQFTIEQIAGDLLPEATTRQKIASGYNRLLQTTEEGGAQPKEYTAKYQSDRVRNTAVAWLGLTMGCCECHSHKYDPITIKDFYSFAAFFADVQEKPVGRQDQTPVPTPEQEAELARLQQTLRSLQEKYDAVTPELTAGLAKWEEARKAELAAGKSEWLVMAPSKLVAEKGTTLTRQDDQSVLASGKNPNTETYEIHLQNGPQPATGLRLETLTHDSLAKKSLSRANGNFVLSELEVAITTTTPDQSQPVVLSKAVADFSQDGFPVAHAIDGKADTGWAVAGHEQVADRRAVVVFEKPIPAEATVIVRLKHSSQYAKHNIGRFRLALTAAAEPGLSGASEIPEPVRAALAVAPAERSDEQKQVLLRHYRTIAPELADVRSEIAKVEHSKKNLEQSFPTTLISVSVAPRTVRILPRGNWLDETGEVVSPATPEVLPQVTYEDRQRARLELGRWLVSREQPLTARVFVNRLWKLFFGQGLVRTLDDFGIQGAAPTHPQLLDWLAVEFMEQGWNVKHMIKLMVMSRTYQQSSITTPELRERDPNNQWLARQSAFRLDAEMVRDNALAISGLLSRKIGGRSVKPYQPVGYWSYLNFPKREWQHDQGEDLYRRGLYTHWQRTFLQPSMLAFDAPSREECTVERPRSNTPLQALVLLNDPTYVEAARVFATRVLEQGTAPEKRLEYAFQQALQRQPTDQEKAILLPLAAQHLEQYRQDSASAEKLLAIGEWPRPAGVDAAELAAWTSVCRAILNLHETITRP